ncbi:Uncharacterised protein [Streptococcus pneumoniae]|nr:Uncharacterised protein [Streptococcus pneumoniae]VLU39436.1 Uncharacterised protein [Streptococcus pneumoniae]VRE24692.1 Uncharacterised protein [Streptococcus pneumoniae]
MSSEQQERMAVQYAERSLLFTVKSLLNPNYSPQI